MTTNSWLEGLVLGVVDYDSSINRRVSQRRLIDLIVDDRRAVFLETTLHEMGIEDMKSKQKIQ